MTTAPGPGESHVEVLLSLHFSLVPELLHRALIICHAMTQCAPFFPGSRRVARSEASRYHGAVLRVCAERWLVVVALLLGAACSNHVKRGAALYADGRYVEAAEVFERTEHRLSESTPRLQAEYGLYRGLTFLALGDQRNAHRWLTYAYQVERAAPGSLHGNRRALLERGWYELGSQINAAPPTPSQPPTALAASQPPPPEPPPQPQPTPAATGVRQGLVPH